MINHQNNGQIDRYENNLYYPAGVSTVRWPRVSVQILSFCKVELWKQSDSQQHENLQQEVYPSLAPLTVQSDGSVELWHFVLSKPGERIKELVSPLWGRLCSSHTQTLLLDQNQSSGETTWGHWRIHPGTNAPHLSAGATAQILVPVL